MTHRRVEEHRLHPIEMVEPKSESPEMQRAHSITTMITFTLLLATVCVAGPIAQVPGSEGLPSVEAVDTFIDTTDEHRTAIEQALHEFVRAYVGETKEFDIAERFWVPQHVGPYLMIAVPATIVEIVRPVLESGSLQQNERCHVVLQMFGYMVKDIVPVLLREMNRDVKRRTRSVETLSKIGQVPLVIPMLVQLRKGEPKNLALRSELDLALGRLGVEKAILWIVKDLGSSHAEVRLSAAAALGGFRRLSEADVRALAHLSSDPDKYVRWNCFRELSGVGLPAKPVIEAIVRGLKDEHSDVELAATATAYSLRYAHREILEALFSRARSEGFGRRVLPINARKALLMVGDDAVPYLTEVLKSGERAADHTFAAGLLASISAESAAILSRMVRSDDSLLGMSALFGMRSSSVFLDIFEPSIEWALTQPKLMATALMLIEHHSLDYPRIVSRIVQILCDRALTFEHSSAKYALASISRQNPSALKGLRAAISDTDPALAKLASEAMLKIEQINGPKAESGEAGTEKKLKGSEDMSSAD